jgi:acyl dehydratase
MCALQAAVGRAGKGVVVKFFEDFTVGELEVLDAAYVVTEEEIREVGERWDPQPFHIDPEAAQQSPFGGLVASSVHLFAMAVSLSNTGTKHDPVAAVSALGFDKMRLHAPARPGDELFVRIEVIEARRSKSQPALGVVHNRAEMLNQHDELVFSYESAFLVQQRP